MKVLVIGGGKFIGRWIVEKALDNGHQVTLFNRGKSENPSKLPVIVGDVNLLLEHEETLRGHQFDAVVHCVAFSEKHSQDLVRVFGESKAHLLVLGSCDCYEAFQGINRLSDRAELPLTEDSPLSEARYYWRDVEAMGSLRQSYDKNLMSDVLEEAHKRLGSRTTVFRLPMVYGPHDYQYPGRHGRYIQRILDRREILVMSEREQNRIFTYGYVENIAAAVVHAFGRAETFGKVYNLGEPKSRSGRRWAELYASVADWSFDVQVVPLELLERDIALRNAPPQHLLIDSSLFRRETGFETPISLEEATWRTFSYAKEHPEVLGPAADYQAEEESASRFYRKLDEIRQDA